MILLIFRSGLKVFLYNIDTGVWLDRTTAANWAIPPTLSFSHMQRMSALTWTKQKLLLFPVTDQGTFEGHTADKRSPKKRAFY